MFEVTSSWQSTFPGAHAGVLVMRNVSNPAHHAELEKRKMEFEEGLRLQFAGRSAPLENVFYVTGGEMCGI